MSLSVAGAGRVPGAAALAVRSHPRASAVPQGVGLEEAPDELVGHEGGLGTRADDRVAGAPDVPARPGVPAAVDAVELDARLLGQL